MGRLSDVNLNRLRVFVAVVESGSLTAAAGRIGIAKTMASAHMKRLEAEVGAVLLLRTTRRSSLTEAGEAFYEASRRILDDAEEAIAAAASSASELRGTVRLSATIDYGSEVVAPAVVELQRHHPGLKFDLVLNDRIVDLASEGLDVAIRVGQMADSGYRAVRIGGFRLQLVASPRVSAAAKRLDSPEDLTGLPFIALSVLAQPTLWRFTGPGGERRQVRLRPTITVNSAYALRMAAVAGGGITMLPDFSAAADIRAGRLVHVMPRWVLRAGGIHAVFAGTGPVPRKIRILIDALKDRPTGY